MDIDAKQIDHLFTESDKILKINRLLFENEGIFFCCIGPDLSHDRPKDKWIAVRNIVK